MSDPATHAEIKAMLDDQKDYIAKRFDTQQSLLLEHANSMGAHVVEGFEKVGDKLVGEMREMRVNLLPSATNERKVDIKVIMPIVYTLCGVIGSLIIWFTGVKPFIPSTTSDNKVIVHDAAPTTSTQSH